MWPSSYAYILIFLDSQWKLFNPEQIDSIIQAHWPDPVTQPILFETIKRCMVYGPCGTVKSNTLCMGNGRCTKGFPKPFCEQTRLTEDGYPEYYRPNDGYAFPVSHGSNAINVDNQWIVPFNPYFSAKYDCHINVECAVSIASFKYIHKGPDYTTVDIDDEIAQHLHGRYISPPEANWRIYEFDTHG